MNPSSLKIEEPLTQMNVQNIPFDMFLGELKTRMNNVIHVRADID